MIMKKIIVLLSAVLIFASCEGPMGPTGPEGEPGVATWHIEKVTVKQSDWKLSGNPGDLKSYYYADVRISQLTQYVFDYGTVLGYVYLEPDVKNGLPYVYHTGEEVAGENKLWTQTYDFDFEPGWVRLYVTFSDFETYYIPEEETFGIVLMW